MKSSWPRVALFSSFERGQKISKGGDSMEEKLRKLKDCADQILKIVEELTEEELESSRPGTEENLRIIEKVGSILDKVNSKLNEIKRRLYNVPPMSYP
jgi:sugar-specific transcriptional regulator TrmB